MVPEKGHQAVRIGRRRGVKGIFRKKFSQLCGRIRTGNESSHGALKAKIQNRRHARSMSELRKIRWIRIVDFAKNEEILASGFPGGLQDGRVKTLPKLVVDVLYRIQPKTSEVKALDPIGVNIDHSMDDPKLLGKQII